jgi:hypothetical protein
MKYILSTILFWSHFALATENPYENPSKYWNEGKSLAEKLNKKYELEMLVAAFKKHEKNNDLKLRPIDYYKNTIFLKFDPPFGLKELKAGTLPYFAQGDFDCDKKPDKAVILSDQKTYIQLGSGDILKINFGGDSIHVGKPGNHKTIKGKGYDVEESDPMPATFDAKCDFLEGSFWEKAAVAYVYDKDKKKFIEYYTAD